MDIETPQWLMSGEGLRPELQWTFRADAPIVDLQLSRESSETVFGDEAGGVYRLDRRGRAATISRGFHGLRLVATDDVGRHTAIVTGDSHLSFLDPALSTDWAIDLPDAITALAVSPHGGHVAVGLANGKSVVYDAAHQRVCHIETDRPLQFLHFHSDRPAVIGAAEYGQLLEFDFSGAVVWDANLHANIGGITGTGDGKRLSVATFTQGVKHLDENGQPAGAYLLEGTPQNVAGSFLPHRLAIATIEGHLYWLDQNGELVWGAAVPETLRRIAVEPLGDGLICGFESGRICSLGWN